MEQKTEALYALSAVEVSPLPDGGTDVWLRRNIESEVRTDEESGSAYTVYVADEAFMRTEGGVTVEYAMEHFEALWEIACEYNPATVKPAAPGSAGLEQRVQAVEDTTESLEQQLALLLSGEVS